MSLNSTGSKAGDLFGLSFDVNTAPEILTTHFPTSTAESLRLNWGDMLAGGLLIDSVSEVTVYQLINLSEILSTSQLKNCLSMHQ